MKRLGWGRTKAAAAVNAPLAPSRPLMRPLEPRILLDAAAVETATDAVHEATHQSLADAFIEAQFGSAPVDAPAPAALSIISDIELADSGPLPDPVGTSVEIAFIAHDVPNLDALVAALPSGTEIILLDEGRDGISQIAEALAFRTDIDAVHLISHGSEGALQLGTADLTIGSMSERYKAQLALIGDALAETGDILIYGCDFGGGELGRNAVDVLAQLTGADIAASDDVTGHSDLGGDWDLELHTGSIEASSYSLGNRWFGSLAPVVLEEHDVDFDDISDDEEIGLNSIIGQTFSHDSGGGTYDVSEIELVLRKDNGTPPQNVIVSIRETFSGADIATGFIPISGIGTSYDWTSITFNTPATLNSGQTYFFIVSADLPPDRVELAVEKDDDYANGAQYRDNGNPKNNHDVLFRLIGDDGTPGPNNGPVITSYGGAFIVIPTVDENQTMAAVVTATDPDGDDLTFSIEGGLDRDKFTIDADTGVLSFITPPDFENPTDSNFNNLYTVYVEVSDGRGGVDNQSFSVDVRNINDAPVATGGAVAVDEGETHVFAAGEFGFTDEEGHGLASVTLTGLSLAGGTLTHSGGTLVTENTTLTLAQLASLTYSASSNPTGNASFIYTVTDDAGGVGTASAAMDITVNPVNDVPVATGGAVTVNQGGPYIFSISEFGFSDEEGDSLASVRLTGLSLDGGALTHSNGVNVTENTVLSPAELTTLTYTPSPNPTGPVSAASFSYTVIDSSGGESPAPAAMSIIINTTWTPPVPDPDPEPDPGTGGPVVPTTGPTPEEPEPDPEEEEAELEVEPQETTSGPVVEGDSGTPPPALPSAPAAPALAPAVIVPVPQPEPIAPPAPVDVSVDGTDEPILERPSLFDYKFTQVDQSALSRDLERTGEELRQPEHFIDVAAAKVTFAFGSFLSVGGVTFILRGGAIAAALMSAMPAWGRYDPISIVTGRKDENEDEEHTDVEMMLSHVQDARARVKEETA